MEKAGLLAGIPKEVWTKSWNVNSQAEGSSEAIIKYLAPYVFRVAISNHRIAKVVNGKVTFTYTKGGLRQVLLNGTGRHGVHPPRASSPPDTFEPLPLYTIQCQLAGLLEHWIEPTLRIGSILMGYISPTSLA